MNIDSIRNEYKYASLSETSIDKNPIKQFENWLNDALNSGINYPTAMILSTYKPDKFPETRTVLLKSFDNSGFTFFTNYNSLKGKSIKINPAVGLLFFWPELERQVRISGYAEKTSAETSDDYFESRPEMSRIAVWASDQSHEIPSRKYLEDRFKKYNEKFQNGNIPRPKNWGGYLVKPVKIEFWQGRENRLHDRILYEKKNKNWIIKRLAP